MPWSDGLGTSLIPARLSCSVDPVVSFAFFPVNQLISVTLTPSFKGAPVGHITAPKGLFLLMKGFSQQGIRSIEQCELFESEYSVHIHVSIFWFFLNL